MTMTILVGLAPLAANSSFAASKASASGVQHVQQAVGSSLTSLILVFHSVSLYSPRGIATRILLENRIIPARLANDPFNVHFSCSTKSSIWA